ncbi:MAG TPA: CZB domain-containing protein [Ignavibacteriaceae bacterium]|nr:CZB domain-containing protein [Ignavibacteriaceae bacterium]
MITKEVIDNALSAHVQWKKKLQEVLDTGKSEFKVSIVKKDDQCQFGQWLKNLSEQEKKSPEYGRVSELHAQFHLAAAEILDLALKGKKEEAQKKLQLGGGYGQISGKLVLALQTWRNKLI